MNSIDYYKTFYMAKSVSTTTGNEVFFHDFNFSLYLRFADQDRDGIIDIEEFSQLWQLIKIQGYKIVNVENKDAWTYWIDLIVPTWFHLPGFKSWSSQCFQKGCVKIVFIDIRTVSTSHTDNAFM